MKINTQLLKMTCPALPGWRTLPASAEQLKKLENTHKPTKKKKKINRQKMSTDEVNRHL